MGKLGLPVRPSVGSDLERMTILRSPNVAPRLRDSPGGDATVTPR